MTALSSDAKAFAEVARAFVEEDLIPLERQVEDGLPDDVWKRLVRRASELGFTGLGFPAEYGGVEAGVTVLCAVMREFGRTSHSFFERLLLSVDRTLVYGSDEQKRRWLAPAIRGDLVTAFALSEPQSGSDARNLKTRAERRGDNWVISGHKVFTTLAPIADVVVTVAMSGLDEKGRPEISVFLVPTDTPGFSCGGLNDKAGYRGVPQSDTFFDGCMVGPEALLGRVGQGWEIVGSWTGAVRLVQAAICIGSAERCLDLAIPYANERTTFGQPLASRQAIQWMLADSAIDRAAAIQLTVHAARLADEGQPYAFEASCAKVFATEMAPRVIDRAQQIFGGYGYMRDYPFDMLQRDVRLARIGGGSTEMMRILIARDLLAGRRQTSSVPLA
jgi:alkylation response protein AidB-like acyl-CoA dehydrogenase